MKNTISQVIKRKVFTSAVCAAVALSLIGSANFAPAQSAPTLPPGVQDVVKMSQAGLGEDVIMAQVKNTGATYQLNADQIIYLSKSGVSQNIIKTLITDAIAPIPTTAPAPVPSATVPTPPVATVPPAAPIAQPAVATAPGVNYDSFHDQLAPYGTWVQVAGYGWCWRPNVAAFDGSWHPYGEGGHWIYTENGWYWDSEYPWGNIAFHYGRWYRDGIGWLWVPGYDWAPAWVAWRHCDGYVGWAPLPPAAVFRAGVGLEFGGRVGVDLDFGLPMGAFVFVGYDHFWDHSLHGWFLPHDRCEWAFHHSVIMNGYRFNHGRFVVEGIGHDRIGLYTHNEVRYEAPHGHFEEHRVTVHDDRHFGRDHDRFH